MLPKQSSGFESKGRKWMFSLSLLFDCITRVINRKHHSTLCGNPSRSTSVLIEIYNKFRNFQVTKGFLQKHGIYKKIEIPFIQEVYQFEKNMDSNMMKELINIFDNHEPGQMVA